MAGLPSAIDKICSLQNDKVIAYAKTFPGIPTPLRFDTEPQISYDAKVLIDKRKVPPHM